MFKSRFFLLLVPLIQVDQNRTSGPACLQLRLIPQYINLLGVRDMPSLYSIIMSKGPICRVDAILIIIDHVVNKKMVIVSVEEYSDWFVLVARDEVKMILAGELVYLKDAPDGIVETDDGLLF